jgi:hypothetical protein
MAVTVRTSPDSSAIRLFTVEIPVADLEDLRARIAATRFPERETVEDDSQGVPLATMQELARYWATSTTGAAISRPGNSRSCFQKTSARRSGH